MISSDRERSRSRSKLSGGARIHKSTSDTNLSKQISMQVKKFNSYELQQSFAMSQLAPNVEEVQNLYKNKSAEKICLTLLSNLSSNQVCNKNEHLKQFFKLYQE